MGGVEYDKKSLVSTVAGVVAAGAYARPLFTST